MCDDLSTKGGESESLIDSRAISPEAVRYYGRSTWRYGSFKIQTHEPASAICQRKATGTFVPIQKQLGFGMPGGPPAANARSRCASRCGGHARRHSDAILAEAVVLGVCLDPGLPTHSLRLLAILTAHRVDESGDDL